MTLWLRLREAPWLRNSLALPLLLIPYWLKWADPPDPFAPTYVMGFVLSGAMLLAIAFWFLLGMPGIGGFFQRGSRLGWAITWGLLAFWSLLTETWAFVEKQEPGVAQNFALQMVLVGGFCLMLACAAPSPRFVLGLLIINGLVAAFIGGAQVACQCSLGLSALGEVRLDPMRSGVSVIAAEGIRWLRPYALLPHPNVTAGLFIMGVFASAGLILSRSYKSAVYPIPTSAINADAHSWLSKVKSVFARAQHAMLLYIVLLTAWIALAWMLLLSFSRGAWAGTGLGALIVLAGVIGRRETRRALVLLALLGIILGIFFFALYRPLIVARTGAGQENTEMRSLADRVVYGQIAQAAIAKAPLIGLGGGNTPWYASYYLAVYTDYDLQGDHVHNIYLETWSDLGLIGLVLFIALQAFGLFASVQAYRRTGDVARLVMIGGWMALALVGFVDHYPWSLVMGQTLWIAPIAVAMGEERTISREIQGSLQNS
jgi:O-antigen ligase